MMPPTFSPDAADLLFNMFHVVLDCPFLCDVIEDSAPPSLQTVILVVRWGRIFDDVIEESAPL